MSITAQNFVNQIIPHTSPQQIGKGKADVNIALSKYWGKRQTELNLPTNSSLSISLPDLGTETELQWIKIEHQTEQQIKQHQRIKQHQHKDQIYLNHKLLNTTETFSKRLCHFLDYFRPTEKGYFQVKTFNTVPTAAGLASSASGYAALVLALNDLFQWSLPKQQLSLLARLGSGSASRSIYDGFVIWQKGQDENGFDSFASPLSQIWSELCIGLVEIDLKEKLIGSTTGMQKTVETCEIYQAWPQKAEKDLKTIQTAIEQKDFNTLGKTAENNALTMHATMMATWPPIVYWQPESITAMHKVWDCRKSGIDVYFTMDAGPNLKLLFLEESVIKLMQYFPALKVIKPFSKNLPPRSCK